MDSLRSIASVVVDTPLARHLAGAPPRPSARDAFERARRWFLAGQRIDMQLLADEIGVNRATLYRWVGNRDQFLAEILWSLGEPTLQNIVESTPGAGGDRISRIVGRLCQTLVDSEPLRAYLTREPESALRLITRSASPVQRRFRDAIEALLAHEVAAGNLHLPLELADLAYVITRIAESFIYTDLITGEPPAPEKAEVTIATLLR